MPRALRHAIPAVAVFVALLLPATAAAATPLPGHYTGGSGVSFTLFDHGYGAGMWVGEVRYHGHEEFDHARVNPQHHWFESCARVPVTRYQYREYCVGGTFVSANHATGDVRVYEGSNGRRATHPFEVHAWSASHTG